MCNIYKIMEIPYDITLDLDMLPDLFEAPEYLIDNPGESYRESINLKYNNNNKVLDISVILLCHGGKNSSISGLIKKNHNFWEDDSNVMFNSKGEHIVGIRANNIRVYNDIGSNVTIINNIYKILIGAFYFSSLICSIFLYLNLNLFRSRKGDKKIYPYKKLYSIGRNKKIFYLPPYKTNMVNGSNVQNSDYERINQNKKFNHYIPNSSLKIQNDDGETQNYICFIIKNEGILQIFKLIFSYENIKNIFKYNNYDVEEEKFIYFLNNLSVADMITIIYNTIEKNIYPKYQNHTTININLDLIYCKGALIAEEYVIAEYNKEKNHQLTNEFGYSYVGKFKKCYSGKCKNIKNKIQELIGNRINSSKFIKNKDLEQIKQFNTSEFKLDFYDYFNLLLNIDITDNTISVKEFIDILVNKREIHKREMPEKKFSGNKESISSSLDIILNDLKKLKENDFIQPQRGGYKKNKYIKKNVKNTYMTGNKRSVVIPHKKNNTTKNVTKNTTKKENAKVKTTKKRTKKGNAKVKTTKKTIVK